MRDDSQSSDVSVIIHLGVWWRRLIWLVPGEPITSRTPVPRVTKCMWSVWIPHLYFLVFHHTDTHILVFYLSLALFLHNEQLVWFFPLWISPFQCILIEEACDTPHWTTHSHKSVRWSSWTRWFFKDCGQVLNYPLFFAYSSWISGPG
jgi:hypothetical protein